MIDKNNQKSFDSSKDTAKKAPKTPKVTGYEGTGHEKDPLKTKPSTGREGSKQ